MDIAITADQAPKIISVKVTRSPREQALDFLEKNGIRPESFAVVRKSQKRMLRQIQRPILGYSLGMVQLIALYFALYSVFFAENTDGFLRPILFATSLMVGFSATYLHSFLGTQLGVRWVHHDPLEIMIPDQPRAVLEHAQALFPDATFWVEVLEGSSHSFMKGAGFNEPLPIVSWVRTMNTFAGV